MGPGSVEVTGRGGHLVTQSEHEVNRSWEWFWGELAPELLHLGMQPGAMEGCHHHDGLG